jgi:hypothetical protein
VTVTLGESAALRRPRWSSARACTERPYTLALLGTLSLWALSVGLGLLYQTIRGSSFGRVNDFLTEAQIPLRQLSEGHVLGFLQTSPAYVGSLIGRSPFALLAMALHADWQVVYILTSLPCLMAAPVLGAWLARTTAPDTNTRPIWVWLSPFGLLLALNPIVIDCLILGHPEDVLGASLAIAGVVQAARGKEHAAMLLLGLSVVNKSWAIVAVPVAMVLLPRVSWRGVLLLVGPIIAVYVPITLIQNHHGGSITTSTGSGGIFLATQLWWWFGADSFVAVHAHLLIVVSAFVLAGVWRRTRRAACTDPGQLLREGLLLLALVFLLRAAMDPWNNIYYCLPFLMTVYALELGRAPRWSFAATILMVAITIPLHTSTLDTRAIAYQLGTVPIIVGLGLRVLLAPESWDHLLAVLNRSVRPAV